MIGQMKPGRTVHLSVIRDGIERDYSVTLGEQPADKSESSLPRGTNSTDRFLGGVSVEALTPELARDFRIDRSTKGVVVRRVDPASAAAEAGLEEGDVILEVNRHPVTTVEQMNRYATENTDSTLLLVSRDGRSRYIVISSSR